MEFYKIFLFIYIIKMKNTKGSKNNNLVRKNKMMNNMKNSLSLKIQDVPVTVDVLTVVLIVGLVVLVNSNLTIPEESKLAFLLALIILISCYNVEIAILVTVIAIVYVLVDNSRKNNKQNNNQ